MPFPNFAQAPLYFAIAIVLKVDCLVLLVIIIHKRYEKTHISFINNFLAISHTDKSNVIAYQSYNLLRV